MKQFKDLKFTEHPSNKGFRQIEDYASANRTRARLDFPNGYGISVVCGYPSYSNGVDTYEVGILKDGVISTVPGIALDVMPYQTKEDIDNIMRILQSKFNIRLSEKAEYYRRVVKSDIRVVILRLANASSEMEQKYYQDKLSVKLSFYADILEIRISILKKYV